jgi:hypothetical protein
MLNVACFIEFSLALSVYSPFLPCSSIYAVAKSSSEEQQLSLDEQQFLSESELQLESSSS